MKPSFHIEKSFRMSKHDFKAHNGQVCVDRRPIYHNKREFVALAITRLIEDLTGWSIKRFIRTAAATAPSRSAPASSCSPPRTRYRPTYATPSRTSTDHPVRTNLSHVG